MTTHYNNSSQNTSFRTLYCSGRSGMFLTSTRLDDVTCGSCRRKLIAQSKKVA